jgi:eukaryotic-like serine/threonine-protein kinase
VPLTPSTRIGPYEIVAPLGAGGMGEIYRARDTRLARDVAIKVLPATFAQDPERVGRFEREAKLLASLNHPNIAVIYGVEHQDGMLCLALELIEGESLADRLRRGSPPMDETFAIAAQVATALEAAHEAGIVHRDLKPGNVMLRPDGVVKVLDFGLAKGAATADSSPDLSQSPTLAYQATGIGVILGTAAYMSPEQARGKTVDRRTDIWSFGCLLYEMLTGKQLFFGETVSDTIAKILEREPDWSAIPATVPEKIRDLLRRCLEKDARKRLRDIGDARIELEEAVAARSSKSRIAAAETEMAKSAARARAPVWLYVAAVVALAIAAFALLRPMFGREQRPVVRLSVTEPEGASLNGDAVDCAVSPDGRTLVFVASDSAGTVQLWSRPLDALGGRPMAGTDNASRPFWSADSRWVGFFADGKLKKVRLGGGVETVCSAPNGRGGTWSSKGTIVFAPSGEGPIFAVSASGGEPRQVTTLDSTRHESAHRFPWFLPDGKHFLYMVLPGSARGFEVRAGSIDGGKDRSITTADGAPVYAAPGYLVFLRDRNLVAQRFDAGSMRLQGDPVTLPDTPGSSISTGYRAATVSTNGTLAYLNGAVTNSRLTWYDRSGRTLGVVPVPAAQYSVPSLSHDERRVSVDRAVSPNESDIWVVDLARGVATRFTYGPRQNIFSCWSPDDSRIAFESSRNGNFDIYVKPSSGALPETALVVGRSQFKHPYSWSPDGRFLAFYELNAGTAFDIFVVPTDGSGPPVPYLRTPFQEQFPDISPDGRWMLYNSDESGRPEAYVQSFPTTGHKYQVTTGGSLFGYWRRDGKEILMFGLDGQTVLSAEVLESGSDFRTASPRVLFRTPPNVFGFATTRDGQRFLMPVPEGKTIAQSITVVLHWKEELAKRTADR